MKRDGDIASMFQKQAAKKRACSTPVVEEQNQVEEEITIIEEIVDPSVTEATEDVIAAAVEPNPSGYDVDRLPHDPGKRLPISNYHTNDQDAVRRAYILRGPFRPYTHEFPKRKIGDRDRNFTCIWFAKYDWVEYSIKKDSVFFFVCYLFKNKKYKGKGTDAFIIDGWRNWNVGDTSLLKHHKSKAHKEAQEKYIGYMNPNAAIDNKIEKWSDEEIKHYKIRLTYSLRCIKFLLHQGLAFRGHDESEESSNKGNFIELLKFLATNSEEVNKFVLNNAPGNCSLTSPMIQKQIISCFAIETRKKIIEEIGEDHFAILADESSDVSHKEQLALCLRFVNKLGRPCEHFIGVVHVDDTTSLSLKEAIEAVFVSHGLTVTSIRGQGYDGASNMKGDIKGLKTLIMQESPCAYYVHCFAHQLQLVLVAVAKDNTDCVWFLDQVSLLLNIVGVSSKRHGMLRNARLESITKALECGELNIGTGLNQEMGLARPVPDMEDNYVPYGRSRRFVQDQINDDHFRREVYIGVIDKISQELDNRFDEVNMELLSCMSALNPSNSFASFDAQKVCQLAEFYPKDIFGSELLKLGLQLDTYIDVMRQDDRFSGLENLVDLSVKLVETNRHKVYDLVYLLIKLVLILPVTTASVERAFSGMDFVKTKRRNKMTDNLLDDCLVTFIEKDILDEVDEDDVIKTFMSIRKRRPQK
ncbi:uncharacterized protein LOC101785022 [Setaria italica]|uniref:uncharacterized protein LOC101785022 n=1 Tax=Setaria italica TaxID=4555 RepID=UPI0003508E41|nr:uncharacterized protein LOC101785022 [Setaria italica]